MAKGCIADFGRSAKKGERFMSLRLRGEGGAVRTGNRVRKGFALPFPDILR